MWSFPPNWFGRRISLCTDYSSGLLLATFVMLPAASNAAPVTFSASGPTAADILGTVTGFQTAIGNPNNGNNPGPLLSGRREINWDGGGGCDHPRGDALHRLPEHPGRNITTPGTGFAQATPAGIANDLVAFTNPNYATSFAAFSPLRLFTPIGSNITDVTFFIPGTNGAIPTLTRSFGAVFSDVDLANTTSIQYFNQSGVSLGTFFAPPSAGTATFSFLGVNFTTELIGRVRITTGTTALSATAVDAPGVDVVVMDDFIYGEPLVVPEPTSMTLCLLGLGLTSLASVRRRRRGELVA